MVFSPACESPLSGSSHSSGFTKCLWGNWQTHPHLEYHLLLLSLPPHIFLPRTPISERIPPHTPQPSWMTPGLNDFSLALGFFMTLHTCSLVLSTCVLI